ncbi:MAG: hypothetical protein QOD47_1191 [Gemmatimonadaceae bacterium]|jgi:hypothetical protein|nr:hypothetical protein [Gemmatimonadaceae bacterium]
MGGMSSITAKARLAGILYVVMGIPAWFSLMYIPSVYVVRSDPTATARNIVNGEALYRLGILSELVSQTIFLVLALVLYDLLRDADRKQARLMVMLVGVSVAFEFANCLNLVAPLILLSGADFLSVFSKPQLDALALVFLKLRNSGLGVVSLVWGLWLLPFGVLVFKSGFFPKVLGVLLIVACFAYVTGSVTSIMVPAPTPVIAIVTQAVGGLGELAIVLWMIVMGARVQPPTARLS